MAWTCDKHDSGVPSDECPRCLRAEIKGLRGLIRRLVDTLPDTWTDQETRVDGRPTVRCAGCNAVVWQRNRTGREPCEADCVLREAEAKGGDDG